MQETSLAKDLKGIELSFYMEKGQLISTFIARVEQNKVVLHGALDHEKAPLQEWASFFFSGQDPGPFPYPLNITSLPLFSRSILEQLRKVPFGKTISYGELAMQAGYQKKAARAVGQVCHRNPFPIVVPCHRVVGAGPSFSLTGFAFGVLCKQFLLDLEKKGTASYTKPETSSL